jgi:hypothetical protein
MCYMHTLRFIFHGCLFGGVRWGAETIHCILRSYPKGNNNMEATMMTNIRSATPWSPKIGKKKSTCHAQCSIGSYKKSNLE